MKSKQSAGILLFRRSVDGYEVFLVHPGGPFWAKKDEGAWSVPKGEFSDDEVPLEAALREFSEEVGFRPAGPYRELPAVRQSGGKTVHCWLAEGDCDPAALVSNSFEMEWPPRSGRLQQFPEVDRGAWFSLNEARRRINKAQARFLESLESEDFGAEKVGPWDGDQPTVGFQEEDA